MTAFTTAHFRKLFDYHWHVNQRLLEAAAQLDPVVYRQDPGYGHGSIHSVLVHIRNTDHSYRGSLESGRRPPHVDPASIPDLPALQTAFAQEQAAWQALLTSLSAADIESKMTVIMRDGTLASIPRWHMLQQVILHGMQHQAELAQALTEHGHSPGDLDFMFFI